MWTKDVLELNPRPVVTTKQIGRGKHKIVIVDDFYKHPEQVLEMALSLHYFGGGGAHGNYPGDRAYVSLDTGPLMEALGKAWGEPAETFGPFPYQPVTFSRILNRADTVLNFGQRQPHVDPGVTCMVYLNKPEDCSGGTGIYRHKLTGLERLPMEVNEDLMILAAQHGYHPAKLQEPDGLKAFEEAMILNPLFVVRENRYVDDGNEFWELICLVKMRFNRMVMFDGRMPHSMHLDLTKFRETPRVNQIVYLKGHD